MTFKKFYLRNREKSEMTLPQSFKFNTEIKYFKMDSLRLEKLSQIKNKFQNQGCDIESEHWVLVEKIHGSNSAFVYQCQDGQPSFHLARRNGFVPEKELQTFFNIEKAYQPFVEQLMKLCETACYEMGLDHRHHQVVVYSELYGGNIQKGMRYHDTETILVFDIRVDDTFLSYQKMQALCRSHDIPSVPLIQQGTLDELIVSFREKLEKFNSQVPQCIHQKNVDDAPAEGVILRPLNLDDEYDVTARSSTVQRYKWKKMEHCERPKKKVVTDGEITHLQALQQKALGYINTQRLHTYLSKVGVDYLMNKGNMGKNISSLVKDTLVDIQEEDELAPLLEDKKLSAELRKMISRTSSHLIQTFQFEYIPVEPEELTDEDRLIKIDKHIAETWITIDKIRSQVKELQQRTKKQKLAA